MIILISLKSTTDKFLILKTKSFVKFNDFNKSNCARKKRSVIFIIELCDFKIMSQYKHRIEQNKTVLDTLNS